MTDIINDLLGTMEEMESARPFYGDADKKYYCVCPDTLNNEVVEALYSFRNVTVKLINPAYLPDKDSIYFMPHVEIPLTVPINPTTKEG